MGPGICSRIEHVLRNLKALVEDITHRREKVESLQAELIEVQRDYNDKLGYLNAEAEKLESRRAFLSAQIAGRNPSAPSAQPKSSGPAQPPPTGGAHFSESPPPPLTEDPRAVRKRSLADHIYYFLESSQTPIMQEINAAIADDRQDVGDMLERLAWGEIWSARADWETLDDHLARVQGWNRALEDRLSYWQQIMRNVEDDPRHGLLEKMKESNREEWLAFLDSMARNQEMENARLARELGVLGDSWQGDKVVREPGDQRNTI